MKKISSAKLLFALLGSLTIASAAGSVGGSLAWYAYSTRALVAYSGTSVASSFLLQIGLVSDEVIPNLQSNNSLIKFTREVDSNNTEYYYFCEPGKGLTYSVISEYLAKKGFATNAISPTTSGNYGEYDSNHPENHSFRLRQAPNQINPQYDADAKKDSYAKIPFVFRVTRETANGYIYTAGQDIWLTNAVAKAADNSRDGNIYKAIRCFIDRDDELYNENNDFIFNPSASSKGQTRVGGLLDLTKDVYFDFNSEGEVIYGEYDQTNPPAFSGTSYADSSKVCDVNGSGYLNSQNQPLPSTFNAKHYAGTPYYEDFTAAAIDAKFGHANYESLSSLAPRRDAYNDIAITGEDGAYNASRSVCRTKTLAAATDGKYNIARVDFTVYLEGWDFSVIDEEQAHRFDLGLTFEVSRSQ